MNPQGYYRFPTLYGDTIIFVSEDDLWAVSTAGGTARRLTANLGAISFPSFSPDGTHIAFTGREEGPSEVFVMPSGGGQASRVTFLSSTSSVLGWTPEGTHILFSSDSSQPFNRISCIYRVAPENGMPEQYPVGPAIRISIGSRNRMALGRNNQDPARWKRYRGGTAGEIWVDDNGDGEFHRILTDLKGNLACPLWIEDRIYFLSDHEGISNIYSCTPDSTDLRQHTYQTQYYARFPSTDGRRIVYHAGADIYVYDTVENTNKLIHINYPSARVQRQRKFVQASAHLEDYSLSPKGDYLALNARGKSLTMGCFEGPVIEQDADQGVARLKSTRWLNDGIRVVSAANIDGVEVIQIYSPNEEYSPVLLNGLDIGRITNMEVSPASDKICISNHRNELLCIDLAEKTLTICDSSPYGGVTSFQWSSDGQWIAYSLAITPYQSAIKLWNADTGMSHQITNPVIRDYAPSFDPDGKYLYFLGARILHPVPDQLHFDLGFPKGMKPYLITLSSSLRSPFIAPSEENGKSDKKADSAAEEEVIKPVSVDLDGIIQRVVPFPLPEGIYTEIIGIKGKALILSQSLGAEDEEEDSQENAGKGTLSVYDFQTLKSEEIAKGVASFHVSRDKKKMAFYTGKELHVYKSGEKPDDKSGQKPGRASGVVDLSRASVEVSPDKEWFQMLHEAWQLQKEFFWTEDMSGVDWNLVWERYHPLVSRVGSRGELSDLIWEMQGELGTSHAYEFGGDYRKEPSYSSGFLGADIVWNPEKNGHEVKRIVQGTPGEVEACSPLTAPGVNIVEGDLIVRINGKALSSQFSPSQSLVNLAKKEVTLSVKSVNGEKREVIVRTLASEFPVRYREWVERNREYVHQKTERRIGYVHIPDMGNGGYAEFHRLYLSEVVYDGLVVDVRFNRGGYVSQLIIEKLSRKRVGYDKPRWGAPEPYPAYSVAGPMVALTNQWAGSDGDIFSHVFKLKKLGALLGKRTWGGVIGISPRNSLADGAVTSQPEYSFWFQDVGWQVENYGTDPDEEIDITPQDYRNSFDPQIERAISLILDKLKEEPPIYPDFSGRPILTLPG